MADDPLEHSDTVSEHTFAMDPSPTLRQLARCLVASQKEAEIVRNVRNGRASSASDAELKNLLIECDGIQRQWLTQRLPCLAAAMKLALEVYDTFGPGMTELDDPIEVGVWNNKYFVWEHELSPAATEVRRCR
jgi:hypothetical protein